MELPPAGGGGRMIWRETVQEDGSVDARAQSQELAGLSEEDREDWRSRSLSWVLRSAQRFSRGS